jgi:hypothetical protein
VHNSENVFDFAKSVTVKQGQELQQLPAITCVVPTLQTVDELSCVILQLTQGRASSLKSLNPQMSVTL